MRSWPALFVALALLSGCGEKPKVVRLGIAAQQSVSQLPTYLARELGAFDDAGVKVALEEFAGSSKALEALVGGSLDVVSGYYDQTIQIAAEGRQVQSFATITNSLLIALAVSPKTKRPIETFADLKGATIGVTTLGSATHLFLNYVLSKNGQRPDDVKPVAIGTTARALAAIENSVVDAGVLSDFTILHLTRRYGHLKLLADSRTPEGLQAIYGTGAYPSTALYAQTDWLEKHPGEAKRLVQALQKTIEWMAAHKPEEVAARAPASHHGDDEAIYLETVRHALPWLNPGLRMPPGGPELAARMLGITTVDLKQTYTERYLEP